MTHAERTRIVRVNRPRGYYVPTEEVSRHLYGGWRLLDDCPGFDGALLAPPPCEREEEAA